MIASQLVRRYAHNQQIDPAVADQEMALHYALQLLNQAGLVGRLSDGRTGPLLFKGGTVIGVDRFDPTQLKPVSMTRAR